MTTQEFWDGFYHGEIAVEVNTVAEKRDVCRTALKTLDVSVCDWIGDNILPENASVLGGPYISVDDDNEVVGFYRSTAFKDNVLSYNGFVSIVRGECEAVDILEVDDGSFDELF